MKNTLNHFLFFMQLLAVVCNIIVVVSSPDIRDYLLLYVLIPIGYLCGVVLSVRFLCAQGDRGDRQRSRQTDGGTGDETRS